VHEGPPKLAADELVEQQRRTLASPRRHYAIAARMLFLAMDALYGRHRSLAKFKVLEIVARVPYQAWEQVAYIALTHRYTKLDFAKRVFDRVNESRAQQDNEQWHLLIIQELLDDSDEPDHFLRHRLIPQAIAFFYYQLSVLLFIVRPRGSYRLNADFEDHAEHEYAELVQDNPQYDDTPYDGPFVEEYGAYASLGDLFRQIGHDERVHKEESLARMSEPRFS